MEHIYYDLGDCPRCQQGLRFEGLGAVPEKVVCRECNLVVGYIASKPLEVHWPDNAIPGVCESTAEGIGEPEE